jgi:signal transduction histidine kinase
MGTFGDISPDQERGTEKIRVQASHLLSLINGILEITKIESGTAIVQTDHLDIVDFMSEAKSDYMLPLEKDLILDWDYATDLPIMECDRVKLKQILINLVNNAIKFTDRGYVRVSAHALVDEGILEFRVADTGPGIPDELLPFIFDKFRQIDSATTRNYSGAGLGLYIVKNFVELLGGTIDAHSKVGEGSVFTVRLPIQPRRAGNQTVHSQPKPAIINAL